mmetsp:Transcript_13876/g.45386  ORF Transcript_13876/g.45386 Transcript_13876/m.45386 type:complete len:203 (-) Transcript_13876:324-932(-)
MDEQALQRPMGLYAGQRLAKHIGQGGGCQLSYTVDLLGDLLAERAHHALAQAGQRGAQFDPVGRRVLGRRERAGRRGVPRWRQRQAQQWQHGGHGRLAHPAANVPPVVHLVVIEGREDGPDHAQVQADGQAIAAGLGCVSAQTECAAHLDERAHCVAARLRVAELGNRLRSGRGHERLNRQFKRRPQLRRGQRAYGESVPAP